MDPWAIRAGVRQGCFRIRFGNTVGTCFTQFVNNTALLVTAKHLVEGIQVGHKFALYLNEEWNYFENTKVGYCELGSDLAVMLAPPVLSEFPGWGLRENQASPAMFLGESIAYLGFPLNLTFQSPHIRQAHIAALLGLPGDQPMPVAAPFMKTGHFCGLVEREGRHEYYFDSLNNKGFSGGPVFCKKPSPRAPLQDVTVVAVVVGYHYDVDSPVYKKDADGNKIEVPDYFVRPNSGYMVGVPINYALEVGRRLLLE